MLSEENGPATREVRARGRAVWGVAPRKEGTRRQVPQCSFFSFLVIFRVCWVLVLGASGLGPFAVKGTYQM